VEVLPGSTCPALSLWNRNQYTIKWETSSAVGFYRLCTAYRNFHRHLFIIIIAVVSVTSPELFQPRIPEGTLCLFLQTFGLSVTKHPWNRCHRKNMKICKDISLSFAYNDCPNCNVKLWLIGVSDKRIDSGFLMACYCQYKTA
jgi:hypothetical protein